MDTLFNVKSQVRRKVIRIYFCDGLVWKGYSPIMRIVSEANTRNGLEYQPNMRGDLIDEYEELLLIHGGGSLPTNLLYIYHVVPGAGSKLVDETDLTWPINGATCTEPRLAAT